MRGRVWITFLTAAVFCALSMGAPHATEISCVSREQGKILEPKKLLRGYGIREGALVKLSVTPEGFWLLTISPPEMNGAVCIVMMGSDWHFVTSAAPGGEAAWTAR